MAAAPSVDKLSHPGGPAPNTSIVGATIASAATIAPDSLITPISGTAEITTITLPYTGFAGFLILIPAGAFTMATGGNIAKAIIAVALAPVIVVYNPSAALWYPMVP